MPKLPELASARRGVIVFGRLQGERSLIRFNRCRMRAGLSSYSLLSFSGLLLLSGCAQPHNGNTTSDPGAPPPSGQVVIATPGVAAEMQKSDGPFPAVPGGYRALGGVFSPEGKRVIVAADMDAAQGDDMSIGLAHGMAILAHSDDDPAFVAKADCVGTGVDPDHAITVANLAKRDDDVQAGIACARLMHPGSHVAATQLIARDNRYLTQLVMQTADGRRIILYDDATGFAQQLSSALH